MHTLVSRLATTTLTVGMIGLMTACTQGEPGHVNPASIGTGSSTTRPLQAAPTPALSTVGAADAPSFGPGIGAELNTGIGVQRYNPLVP